MNNPLISILMPVKNTENYLADCINSIINQSEKNWELIAVDDFSTDSSPDILQQFSHSDSRIKFFNNVHSGIIGALRLALEKSSGELISRMDSDDMMYPRKLEILKNNLLSFGTGHLALGGVDYFSDSILGEGFKNYELWLNALSKTGSNFLEIYKECVIPSPCWMCFKSDLIKCKSFDENTYPEDYDLAFRFYEQGLKCIPCDEKIHQWRDYTSRTSRTHAHYADNSFMELKVKYFMKLHWNPEQNLVLWGAGDKGKKLAQLLIKNNLPFSWICDNPKKIGKEIFGKILLDWKSVNLMTNSQSIITVANHEAQVEIKKHFKTNKLAQMKDYFFFC